MALAAVLVAERVYGVRVDSEVDLNSSTRTFENDVASSGGAYAPGVHKDGIQKAWDEIMADPVQANNFPLQGENGLLLQMLEGVAEPDNIACPGDIFMPGTMLSSTAASAMDTKALTATYHAASWTGAMLSGTPQLTDTRVAHDAFVQKYKVAMSPCRKASQVYHGSPLPLVWDEGMRDPVSQTNGAAVMNYRQWRNGIVQVMSHQFLHAILTPDIYDGARKLGNAMHTLSDTFSDSHVKRFNSAASLDPLDNRFDGIREACSPESEACECAFVYMALSMDVSNMVYHVPPDYNKDWMWECSVKFEVASIERWAKARLDLNERTYNRLEHANTYAKDFIDQVLCPSLQFLPHQDGNNMPDMPAGGAPAEYSWEEAGVYPSAVINPSDASEIVRKWNNELAADRSKDENPAVYPHEIYLSEQSVDVCGKTYSGALLTLDAYSEIVTGQVRNYIIPEGIIPQR